MTPCGPSARPALSFAIAQNEPVLEENVMFEILNFIRKRRLTHDQLRALQLVSQQVVLSLEGSVRLPGATKKALALKLVGELTRDLGFVPRTA